MRLLKLSLITIIVCFSFISFAFAEEKRPNILFIFTDDQAPWAVGAAGHPHCETPNIDRIFNEGAYLKNTFTVTPVCSPSRASLMTSRYGTELNITDWLNPRVEPKRGLDPSTVCFPEVIQKAGYTTGLVGKWHLGLEDQFHPTKTGFDYFMGFRGGGNSPNNPKLEKDGVEKKFEGLTPDILTDHALEFVKDNQQGPFMLCLHFRAPHARWLPVAPEDWAPYENLDPEIPNPEFPNLDVVSVKKKTREYLASVASVDRNVGRVLDQLEQLKLDQNTIVIFSSDHGYSMGHNGIWHKGNGHWILTKNPPATDNVPAGQRPNMWDNSINIPTAVRWPGVVAKGTEIEQTISIMDFYPTLVAMAGADLPEGEIIRGRNFIPVLKGKAKDWDNDFYAQYSTIHQSKTHMRMYRTPQHKLILDFNNKGRNEFYDLKKDPAEANNLFNSKDAKIQKLIKQLKASIHAKMVETKDPVLELAETN
ncbi:MAG: sulfatase family protein [Pirellulales bacterium]